MAPVIQVPVYNAKLNRYPPVLKGLHRSTVSSGKISLKPNKNGALVQAF
jgi:hypothetical protein